MLICQQQAMSCYIYNGRCCKSKTAYTAFSGRRQAQNVYMRIVALLLFAVMLLSPNGELSDINQLQNRIKE